MNRLVRNSIAMLLVLSTYCAFAVVQPSNYFAKSQDAYFNHQTDLSYNDPYRGTSRIGADFESILIDGVKLAKKRVWLAVLDFDLTNFASELAVLKKSGVDVRVVVDNQYNIDYSDLAAINFSSFDEYNLGKIKAHIEFVDTNRDGVLSKSELNERDSLTILKNAGIPIVDDSHDGSAGSGLMHHKFVVVDDEMTIVTSANFTRSDIHGDFGSPGSIGNANALIYFKSPALLKSFEEEFSIMWGKDSLGFNGSFGLKKFYRQARSFPAAQGSTTVQFSPTSTASLWENSVNGLIGRELAKAKKSILMDLFVFTEQRLVNIIEPLHSNGVGVEVLIDPGFATRYYSEMLDMWGTFRFGISTVDKKCFIERDNKMWSNPITKGGVPSIHKDDKLHHKFAVIDESTVIFGSQNWSAAANNTNDETLLVVNDKEIAAKFVQEHKRLMQGARVGPSPSFKRRIQAEKEDCADGTYDSFQEEESTDSSEGLR